MATAMSSSLTGAHRRKRIATYGKSTRTPAAFNIHDDAPSPERPRKQVGGGMQTGIPLKRPTLAASASSSSLPAARASRPERSQPPSSRDVFDLPSDADELAPRPVPPAKRPAPANPMAARDEFDVPSSDDEPTLPRRRTAKPAQPLKKTAPLRRLVSTEKQETRQKDQLDVNSSDDVLASSPPQSKSLQAPRKPNLSAQPAGSTTKRPLVKPKPATRATNPAPSMSLHKRQKSASTLPSKPSALQRTADIFDVPSSEDEDLSQRASQRPKPASLSRPKTPIASHPPSALPSPAHPVESDDSAAAKKRKRQAGQAPQKVIHDGIVAQEPEITLPRRSNKYRKKEGSVSPGNDIGIELSKAVQKVVAVNNMTELSINKPRRTKTRTVPIPLRPPVKALTSPAQLSAMLDIQEPEVALEDETMYDIPVTPARASTGAAKASTKSIVTPRQKEIFGNLLDDSSETITPGILKLGKLQLSERRTGTSRPGLVKSVSNISSNTKPRKPKLIDSLIRAGPSIEEDDEGSSDSFESSEDESSKFTPVAKKTHGQTVTVSTVVDDMEVDNEPLLSSQASQNALSMHRGPKVTYAKQRSYREEASFEDELLLSIPMDTDMPTPRGFGQRKMQPDSEGEDERTKRVRGIHELRNSGRALRFEFETSSLVDDTANRTKSGKSQRRTAMMELCKQMATDGFISRLFDSALGGQLVKNWSSAGEIIFDFAVALAVALIVKTDPGPHILSLMYNSQVINTLTSLLDFDSDINRIAKERRTNMSPTGISSVLAVQKLASDTLWTTEKPDKVSPRLLAMKSLDLLILNLRKAGSSEPLLTEEAVSKLIDIATPPFERLRSGTATTSDNELLHLSFSIMEAASCSKERPVTWSNKLLRRLVDMMPVFFTVATASPMKLAIRLTMNLTNNKPKACDVFADHAFVQPLVRSISERFVLLSGSLEEDQRMDVLECLILSLGAMINLAEFSDAARAAVCTDDGALVEALVGTFLEGLKRAAHADSMEASQSNVATGYLTVLLGNLCLNDDVRHSVRARLPGGKIDMLVDAVVEFIHYNEKVDRETREQFDGEEGRETYANFTRRLWVVAERVREADG